jgi:hypothetical protein
MIIIPIDNTPLTPIEVHLLHIYLTVFCILSVLSYLIGLVIYFFDKEVKKIDFEEFCGFLISIAFWPLIAIVAILGIFYLPIYLFNKRKK